MQSSDGKYYKTDCLLIKTSVFFVLCIKNKKGIKKSYFDFVTKNKFKILVF